MRYTESEVRKMYKLLVADDEPKIREAIRDYMSAKGFEVLTAADGEQAVTRAAEETPDVIVLDVMMPRTDGFAACREIRAFTDAPVLFLTALGEEEDFLNGYARGGDDYVVKPFPLSVLYQKLISVLRRYNGADEKNQLAAGGVVLDLNSRMLETCGRQITLCGKDFAVLQLLMRNRGRTLSREQIVTRIWGYGFDGSDRVADTHIKRVRRALGGKAELIKTVTGVGYVFDAQED
ncbi:MAG: response regulator transcription factor [Clostridia bacterium]|nr:response regulator transcription factor [Clostridia bacterium]